MSQNRIFFGNVATGQIYSSVAFENASGIYLQLPDDIFEIEINLYFQIQVSPTTNRIIKIDREYTLSTEEFLIIPEEVRNLGELKYIAFTTDVVSNLEIWAVYDDIPSNKDIEKQLDIINERLRAIVRSQLAQNQVLKAMSETIGIGLAAPTGDESLTLPLITHSALAQIETELLLLD